MKSGDVQDNLLKQGSQLFSFYVNVQLIQLTDSRWIVVYHAKKGAIKCGFVQVE